MPAGCPRFAAAQVARCVGRLSQHEIGGALPRAAPRYHGAGAYQVIIWLFIAWWVLVLVVANRGFRSMLGPLVVYVGPYSTPASGETAFVGGASWLRTGAFRVRATYPLVRLTVTSDEVQLGPSVRALAVLMPTLHFPRRDVSVSSVAASGLRPARMVIETPHGGVEFFGANLEAAAALLGQL